MAEACMHYVKHDHGAVESLVGAWEHNTRNRGAATAVVASLDGETLTCASVGDCQVC